MTVSDNTLQVEGLGCFFKNPGGVSAEVDKILATIVLKKPSRGLEITSNIVTAAATKSPKTALSSLPEVSIFYHTRRGLYLGNFV